MAEPYELDDFDALRRARTLWAEHRLDDALVAFDAATTARPRNIKGLIEAARAFGQRHEVPRAERLLAQAERLAGHDQRVAPVIAQAYGSVFRPALAIARFEALRDAGQGSPMVFGELARLYENSGRIDEARASIAECARLSPGYPEPEIAAARLDRRAGLDAQAERALRAVLARVPGPPLLLAEVWSELCAILDARGEFELAADANEKAKAIMRALPGTPHMLARAEANNRALGALAAEFDAGTVARWASPPFDPDPRCAGVAHLIGFPRSGTTLLEQILDAHPRLADSPERLVFTRDVFPRVCAAGGGGLSRRALDAVPRAVLVRERARYLDLMEGALGEPLAGRVHLDKNPNHTSLLPGLFRLFPESRFIVALRDPRDVIVSCVMRSFRLTEFSAAMLSWRGACEMYAFEMGAWLRAREALPADSFVEVRYEDTVADLEREARRALATLGLEWRDDVRRYRELAARKVVNSPTQGEVRRAIYTTSIGRWKHYARQLDPHMPLLQPFIERFGYLQA